MIFASWFCLSLDFVLSLQAKISAKRTFNLRFYMLVFVDFNVASACLNYKIKFTDKNHKCAKNKKIV